MHNEADGTVTLFAVNHHASETIELEVGLHGLPSGKVADHQVMSHSSLTAVNTAAKSTEVVPKKGTGATVSGGKLTAELAPYSYQMIRLTA